MVITTLRGIEKQVADHGWSAQLKINELLDRQVRTLIRWEVRGQHVLSRREAEYVDHYVDLSRRAWGVLEQTSACTIRNAVVREQK
ncbi:hypothetical protein M1116_03130 [Patescibacteria group bacterium]|nr:hypothetical protein [Patescibacteria group bacterium]